MLAPSVGTLHDLVQGVAQARIVLREVGEEPRIHIANHLLPTQIGVGRQTLIDARHE